MTINLKTMALLTSLGLLSLNSAHAMQYYVCGSDEDGCNIQNPSDCLATPVNPKEQLFYQFYTDTVSCPPLSQWQKQHPEKKPSIDEIAPNQQTCLSVIYDNQCTIQSQAYVNQWHASHKIAICDNNSSHCA